MNEDTLELGQRIYVALMSSKTPQEIRGLMSPNARETEIVRIADFARYAAEGWFVAIKTEADEDLLG